VEEGSAREGAEEIDEGCRRCCCFVAAERAAVADLVGPSGREKKRMGEKKLMTCRAHASVCGGGFAESKI